MSKLYEISHRYNNIQELLDAQEFPYEEIKNALDSIDEELKLKIENIVKVIITINSDIDGIKAEIVRLQERKKVMENRLKGLKNYIYENMKASGKAKIESQLFTLSIQKNPKQIFVKDADLIPDKYKIFQKPKIDKKLILQDVNIGIGISGIDVIQNESLRIR